MDINLDGNTLTNGYFRGVGAVGLLAVADEPSRFAITSRQVDLLWWVIQEDIGGVFGVIDLGNLGNEGGYVRIGSTVPSNQVAPALSSTSAPAGTALTCSSGTWTASPTGYGYQWQSSPNGTAGWTDISGATADSYTPVIGDTGNYLRCQVTATNGVGTSGPVPSNVTTPVTSIRTALLVEYLFAPGYELVSTGRNTAATLTNNGTVTFASNRAVFSGANYLSLDPSLFQNPTPAGFSMAWLMNSTVAFGPTSAAHVFSLGANMANYLYNGNFYSSPYYGSELIFSGANGDSTDYIMTFTWDGVTASLYVDGMLITTQPPPVTLFDNSNPLTIGGYYLGNDLFIGTVTKCRIWTRCVTSDEIAVIAAGY